MLHRTPYKKTYWRVVLLFSAVALAAVVVVWVSLVSAYDVSDKANTLVDRHIPELREIAALQAVMNRRMLSLHDYYATTDLPDEEQALKLVVEFGQHIAGLRRLNPANSELSRVETPVARFQEAANRFDTEMRLGRARDWDRLREHLAEATAQANLALQQLESWNNKIRARASDGGTQTLTEIARMNSIQLGFGLAVLLVAVSLLAVLYARMRDQAKLVHIAHHDELTGLPNRHSLRESARHDHHRGEVPTAKAVMWLGLDRIGLISGTFGHLLGDQLLQAFSRGLEELLENCDAHARLYSFGRANWVVFVDEFPGALSALDTVRLIEAFTSRPLQVDDRELNVSCSIGVTYFQEQDQSLERTLREADTARRAAFDAGGNCHRVYQEEMTRSAELFLSMESNLRSALHHDAFELYYQPKVAADSGKVYCAEALLRWQHGGRYISPAEFIPVAEQTGLVVTIGTWVLRHVCQRWMDRRQQGEPCLPVAVNISAQQFRAPDFPALVQAILADTRMPPEMLELEITEEAADARPELVVQVMQALKDIGVTLAIDDFGTGYSSLAYLKRFPIDVLKIDRAFVAQLEESAQDRAIVQLVIKMAHELGFSVVAEGVETHEQHRLLHAMSCDLLQGFLFSKPLPERDYLDYVKQQERVPLSRSAG